MSILNSGIVPVGSTGYDIDNSLRFNDDDSAYLSRTPSVAGNRKTWTWSGWVKRGNLSTEQAIFWGSLSSPYTELRWETSGALTLYDYNGGYNYSLITSQLFRDTSAWYHIVAVLDTTAPSAKLYVNGSQITALATNTQPSSNFEGGMNTTNIHTLGVHGNTTSSPMDGYLAEVNFVDGQALTPADFGETDEDYGHWKAKKYEGTYGTNGFYLDFLGNSVPVITDSSSTSALTINTGITHSSTQQKFGATSIALAGGGGANTSSGYGIEYAGTSNNCPNGVNDITFECWLYVPTGESIPAIWHARGTPDYYLPLLRQLNGYITFYNQTDGGANGITITSSVLLPLDQWVHIACTISNKAVTLYQNGTQVASNTYTTGTWTIPSNNQMIGAGGTNCYMDEIRISNSIRYTGTFTPPTTVFTDDANTTLLIHSDYDEDNSLGADNSPNNNHWTPNNLAATDQMLDSPTNNFCTLNPLNKNADVTLSEGNLKLATTLSNRGVSSTYTRDSSKFYFEVVRTNAGGVPSFGVASPSWNLTYVGVAAGGGTGLHSNGIIYKDGAQVQTGLTSVVNGDIVGVACDFDADSVSFYINNTQVGTTVTGVTGEYTPAISGQASTNLVANFGQDSSFAGNKTAQGNADGNGIGDFYYTPPTGYLALCTQNLPEPTVVPSEHFNTVTYTGNSTDDRSVTGVGFQPGFSWFKVRNHTYNHVLVDAVRGVTNLLESNTTDAEENNTNIVQAFEADGFELGTNSRVNNSSYNYVAWNWKANGAGVSNTNGTITSTVSANVDAGFSIVSYSGNSTVGATVGHGLNIAPDIVFTKATNATSAWNVNAPDALGDGYYLFLHDIVASAFFNATWTTNSTNLVLANGGGHNQTGRDYIAYAFHSVEGYSKVGSYTGNGSTDGTFVHCGFRPAYVMIKGTDTTYSWDTFDNKRDPINDVDGYLAADSSDAENHNAVYSKDFLSNGFKLRTAHATENGSGNTYIYIAFAEHPFKHSNAR
jgi:hypothetical protein